MDAVSENLVALVQELYQEHGGNKRAVAQKLGMTSSNALEPYVEGTIGMPKGKAMQAIAQILEQRYGHPFTPRDVMAWMWGRSGANGGDSEKLDLVATLLDDCMHTLDRVSSEFKNLSSDQDRGSADMCIEFYRLFVQRVSERYDFRQDGDYERFCEDFEYNPVGQVANHLRDVVLGKAIAHRGDWSDIARILSALGDRTTVADLASRCTDCED